MLLASHPSRVRGLKREMRNRKRKLVDVAPLAGAWIETPTVMYEWEGIKVAPLAGAWIETSYILSSSISLAVAPSRVRG